ncbi:MAG TPA: C13 family peptidase [Rhodanobacteraceae bacterium]|nr:C13 family peptidase [Rhodanobacteraceae bacterium]
MKRFAPLALAALLGCLIGTGIVCAAVGVRPRGPASLANAAAPATATVSPPPAGAPPPSYANWPAASPTPEQVLYAQPELLDREIARLRPRTPGKVNLYAVAFAGDGSQNVFRNEAEYFEELFSRRLGAGGHVIVLENNPATLATRPLATWSNLEHALDAIAARMDLRQDILLVYFTSHGSEDHTMLVDMDPLPLDQIGATDLPDILAEHAFKYKVVIVNACYSGGFIPPLGAPGTMVITAARSDRSSFGCGEQSALTWFGHALLVDALNRTDNFRQAYALASKQVAAWERRDHYAPSDPQLSAGQGIVAQLTKWRSQFTPGPAVSFAPAPPVSAGSTP